MENWINNIGKNEDIIISSRIRIARNIEGIKFPKYLEIDKARELVDTIYNVISKKIDKLNIIKMWENQDIRYDFLKEKHLIDESIIKNKEKSAVLYSEDEIFTAFINCGDHLRLQLITNVYNLKEVYKYISSIDDLVDENLNYSFNEKLGYLTANPNNVGTGLKASVLIHLPMLSISDEITKLSKGLTRLGMSIKGMYGEKVKAYGNIYQISNEITLGMSEIEIIENLQIILNNFVKLEKSKRENLKNEHKSILEDTIFRAYGILKNARILNEIEVLNLLSDLRLGVEMNILNIDKSDLNKIMFLTRNSVIKENLNKKLTLSELNIERANIVRKILN